jgi:predicted DNA-binding transcriptional regulator AlpA
VTDHLVGVQEIAKMLGITRQRVDRITRTHDDFPAPAAELASGRIWKRVDVERWARKTGRLPRSS